MTASRIPFRAGALIAPVVDYEPPPLDAAAAPAPCPAPTPAALHRRVRRPLRASVVAPPPAASVVAPPPAASVVAPPPAASVVAPPPAAAAFTDAALRRVLEVLDRRRPIAQLRPMLAPPVLDMVFTMTRASAPDKAAVLQRVRLRGTEAAAEVFATYKRGERVRAIAGRIEAVDGRWRVVALQIG